MNFLRTSTLLFAGVLAFVAPRSAGADPPWWEGHPEDIPAAAAQTGKPVVLYFTSPTAAECIRMDEETWRKMNRAWADLQFLWLKLEPSTDPEFFKHYQINQVPQVVVLDSQMRDQFRLRGFLSFDEVRDALSRVKRTLPSNLSTPSGRVVPASNPILGLEESRRNAYKGHLYFEDFDAYRLIGSIRNPPFDPVVQAASRIDPNGGVGATPCLAVDSGRNPRAIIRIDVSQNFDSLDQVLGRIRVRTAFKPVSALGSTPVEVMALHVFRIDDLDVQDTDQFYFVSLSDKDRGAWRQKEIVSGPINFRLNKAFLVFNAPEPNTSFLVDDITVDLIPVDDMVPYVELDAEIKTIANLPEELGTPGELNPDDFFQQLSSRTEVTPATVLSNSGFPTAPPAQPAAPQRPLMLPGEGRELTDEEIERVADLVEHMTTPQRRDFYNEHKIAYPDRLKIARITGARARR
jgi:hypothetical protein